VTHELTTRAFELALTHTHDLHVLSMSTDSNRPSVTEQSVHCSFAFGTSTGCTRFVQIVACPSAVPRIGPCGDRTLRLRAPRLGLALTTTTTGRDTLRHSLEFQDYQLLYQFSNLLHKFHVFVFVFVWPNLPNYFLTISLWFSYFFVFCLLVMAEELKTLRWKLRT